MLLFVDGFPLVYTFTSCLHYNALVMQLLGPNLRHLFEMCNRKFSLKTVIMIALQLVSILKYAASVI